MTTLLIVGATGLVGGHALRLALADPRITRVVAPTRRALPAHAGLENPVVDFAALDPSASWWAVDGVVCALGTTRKAAGSDAAFRRVDVDHVLAVATHARRAGARAFALNSSVGADAASGNLYLRCKGEAEQGVAALRYPSLTVVRPSLIGGERAEHRPLEALGAGVMRVLGPLVPARYRVVPAKRIAVALLEAALAATPGLHVRESETL